MHTPFQPSEQVWATLEAMNEASHRGQPFFFILDFELQEGVFVLALLCLPHGEDTRSHWLEGKAHAHPFARSPRALCRALRHHPPRADAGR